MICGLFEASQQQHAFFHFSQTTACYSEHFAFVGHQIGEQHDVSNVDAHAVRCHRVDNLVYDGRTSRFDAHSLEYFERVIRCRVISVDSLKI